MEECPRCHYVNRKHTIASCTICQDYLDMSEEEEMPFLCDNCKADYLARKADYLALEMTLFAEI